MAKKRKREKRQGEYTVEYTRGDRRWYVVHHPLGLGRGPALRVLASAMYGRPQEARRGARRFAKNAMADVVIVRD